MLNSKLYGKACQWFQLLQHQHTAEQHRQLDQLKLKDAYLAQLVSELLHADIEVGKENFLETGCFPQRVEANTNSNSSPSYRCLPISKLPTTIGGYEIIDEIGKGGMGVVYRAYHARSDRYAAVKVIRSGSFSTHEQIERFRREARVASKFQHPNIVPVYDVGMDGNTDYFAMALVNGVDLSLKLQHSLMESKEAAHLIRKIALALEFAHSNGIIHRDIKPTNILIRDDGEPMLTDFGLVKCSDADEVHTRSDQILGTINYMAPEQVNDAKNSSPETDVYGLGATLYHCLTGIPPISGNDIINVLQRLRDTLPVAPREICPEIDADLELICLRCIQKDPQDRYASAKHLAVDLGRYIEGEPVEKASSSWWQSITRQMGRDELLGEMPSSTAAVWIAALTLIFHTTVFGVVSLKTSGMVLWSVLAAWFLATIAINYKYHWSQYWQLTPMERQSGIIQLAVHVSFVFLFLTNRPFGPADPSQAFLKVYPPFTLIVAIAFVAHANYFGRILLPATLFFPLSILIAYLPPIYGPLLLGSVGSVIMVWTAIKLRQVNK